MATKLVEARCWLRFLYGSQVNRWAPKDIFKEMALQGFQWVDPPGKWFASSDSTIDPKSANDVLYLYGDTEDGPFHWRVQIDGAVQEGTSPSVEAAIAAGEAAAEEMRQ